MLNALACLVALILQKRDDFVFYSERIIRILLEYAIGQLPHRDVDVTTGCGEIYKGRRSDADVYLS